MKARLAILVGLATAITLTSVAIAGSDATKQGVAITIKFHESAFVLVPVQTGAVKRESGEIAQAGGPACRTVVTNGVKNEDSLCSSRWTLTGKRGTLTLRTQAEWRDGGSPGSCGVAFGTWKVVRGTGDYARVTGGGISAYDAHCEKWYARHEGFLTVR